MKKKSLFIISFSVVLSFAFFLVFFIVKINAQGILDSPSPASYLESNDAIGIRIVPNPEHYSINNWYQKQGFSGSPQSLIVDGYEAIRDGRTVYVNAANIKTDSSNPSSKLIYTNIYLISYNQNPSVKTVDILGQIVKNWKFNTDLIEKSDPAPSCSISSVVCSNDADCGADQFCAPSSSPQANSCQLKNAQNCVFDFECPRDFFCDSVKAKVIRDTKRMGQAVDIKDALNKYKNIFGTYPKLSAGSYVNGHSISLWPSWSLNFLKELSLSNNFIDPINRLGYCLGFDSKTCWNVETKRFYGQNLTTVNNNLILPPNSNAFIYKTLDNGNSFNLCASLETVKNTTDLNFKFSPDVLGVTSCLVAGGVNTPPRFVSALLAGEANKEFVGWVEFIDEQDNPLTWTLSLESAWPAPLTLQNTNNPNQKKIYSTRAGNPGAYKIKLEVSDGQATTTKFFDIVISNTKPFIEAENLTYILNPSKPFVYSFYFSDDNLQDYTKAVEVIKKSGHSFNLLTAPLYEEAGVKRYKATYSKLIPTDIKFSSNAVYDYTLKVADSFGSSLKDIKINIINEAPVLNFNCPTTARLGKAYFCVLGPKKQGGASFQNLTYSSNASFAGLAISNFYSPDSVVLASSNVGGTINNFSVTIQAINEYGAVTAKSFDLKLNTYCGDGVKQTPNSEGRGGIYNDGYEDCDGIDGTIQTAAGSSLSAQYGCTTFNSETPFPIPNNRYCVFKSPLDGGGFCGDGYCQLAKEDYSKCAVDCRHLCVPNKNMCGSDGCGGNHGDCEVVGEACYNGQCCSSQGKIKMFILGDTKIGGTATPSIFFNNIKYDLQNNSGGNYSVSVPVSSNKNVLAIEASKDSLTSGITVSLDHCGRTPVMGTNLKNVKCVNSLDKDSRDDWFKVDFLDNNWLNPNIGWYPWYDGSTQGRASIWANDYSVSNKPLNDAYCRYTFFGDGSNSGACIPALLESNKCGSNGCGGFFRPNNCSAISGDNPSFSCNDATKTCGCAGKTCASENARLGKVAGQEGSICGMIDDGCGNKIDCGYNPSDPGLYCLLSYENLYTDPALAYYKKWNKVGDYQFLENACHVGMGVSVNTYQKKCWYTSFEKSINIRQGDVPNTTICSVTKRVDNPGCLSYSDPICPSQCNTTKTLISTGLINDRCWNYSLSSPFAGIAKQWTPRKEWQCSTKTVEKKWYYNDLCFPEAGERVKSDGTCGACRPQCDDASCGASDGCGGTCSIGICRNDYQCSDGVCVSCDLDCASTLCGDYNSCGITCKNSGLCENNGQCSNGACQVTCTPNCTNKDCGAADGCGGTCSTGTCPTNKTCVNGACQATCTPNCTNKDCGAADGCGGTCSTGTCPTNKICVNGVCESTTLLYSCAGQASSCSTLNEAACYASTTCFWVPTISGYCAAKTPDPFVAEACSKYPNSIVCEKNGCMWRSQW